MRYWPFLMFCTAAVVGPSDAQEPPTGIPAWVMAEMAFLTRDGGRWITDNAAYQSANEPYDAYGLEWTWGIGERTARGRLFGLQNGGEVGTFWEFRMVWHPGTRELLLYQFGADGTLGVGPMTPVAEGLAEAVQTFHFPDGTSARRRHLIKNEDDTHETRSFDEDGSGWAPRRTYVWKRERRDGR